MRFLNKVFFRLLTVGFFFIIGSTPLSAQYTLNKGYDNIEIRGSVTSLLKHRWYPDSAEYSIEKQHKNLMRLKDARIRLKGSSMKSKFKYELHLDFANLANNSNQPEVPLLDGYVTYCGPLDVTLGYTKLPFSRESMTPIIYSPWLKRSMIVDEGQSRRDVGIHLEKGFLSDKINVYASYVNGLPEISKQQDDSLGYELVTRIDLAYPTKMKYRAVDLSRSHIPVVSIGSSMRRSHKGQIYDADDETIFNGVDGVKQSISGDLAIMYKGFSVLVERHHIRYSLDEIALSLEQQDQLANYPHLDFVFPSFPFTYMIGDDVVTPDFYSQGMVYQLTYFAKKYNSVLSLRYDWANINFHTDKNYLVTMEGPNGELLYPTRMPYEDGKKEKTIALAYNYRFNNHLSVLKFQLSRTIFDGFDNFGSNYDYSSRPKMIEIRLGLQYIIG